MHDNKNQIQQIFAALPTHCSMQKIFNVSNAFRSNNIVFSVFYVITIPLNIYVIVDYTNSYYFLLNYNYFRVQ